MLLRALVGRSGSEKAITCWCYAGPTLFQTDATLVEVDPEMADIIAKEKERQVTLRFMRAPIAAFVLVPDGRGVVAWPWCRCTVSS